MKVKHTLNVSRIVFPLLLKLLRTLIELMSIDRIFDTVSVSPDPYHPIISKRTNRRVKGQKGRVELVMC